MGGIVSNPVDDATRQELQDTIKAVLATFTLQYTKQYALALVEKCKEDAQAPEEEEFKLLERPPWSRDWKTGWMMKQGGSHKSWKKRFFVVRPNYIVDYYAKEEEAKKEKGKKKGSIGLCGYTVIEDVNNGVLQRLAKLAEKMGINIDELPKPKKYPEFTLELHHHRRRSYFITCENAEDYKQWVDQFKTCCWWAYGLKNQEICHKTAFNEAVRRTRWELGRWGYWSWGGTEEQVLSDLISDQIDYAVMSKIYSKIVGPWIIRSTIRDKVLKVLDTTIMAAVTPAWKAMETAVEELRPKIEPVIKTMVDPIGKAEQELIDKIKSGIMSIIEPVLKEKVCPHLSKIVSIIKSPMNEGYEESFKLYETEISKFEPKGTNDEVKKQFYDLDWVPRSYRMWPAVDKVDVMYEPLWDLRLLFSDIWPYSLIYKGKDELRQRMDNAVYTFEEQLLKEWPSDGYKGDVKQLVETIKQNVLADYKEDADAGVLNYYADILKTIVMPPFEATVVPACKAVLGPINDAIPEPLKQFIDIEKLFDQLLDGIIDDSIMVVLQSDDMPKKKKHHHKEEKHEKHHEQQHHQQIEAKHEQHHEQVHQQHEEPVHQQSHHHEEVKQEEHVQPEPIHA